MENSSSQLPNQQFVYSVLEDPVNLSSGWQAFFKNSDSFNCPINICKIMQKGCIEEYLDKKIQMSPVEPFKITIKTDIKLG